MRYSRKYWALTERVTDELSTDYFEERVRTKNKNIQKQEQKSSKKFVCDHKNGLKLSFVSFNDL